MQDIPERTTTLVLGGVRSGKSRFAQTLAARSSSVAFIATAQPCDEEMRLKIDRHQMERPKEWRTIEEPLELDRVLTEEASKHRMLVVDCLTLYAANLLEAERGNLAAIEERLQRLYAALRSVPCSVALVSNEVGSGIVPPYPEGRRYRDLLGEINQGLQALRTAYCSWSRGLPLALKGTVEARP